MGDWVEQIMEGTEWRKEAKGQWRPIEHAAMRMGWNKDLDRDKVYGRG